ncbi:hypothetical protein L2E82_30491 [Cichorium intybus]|uniref:Uncharacterized protein n=1 Tax=Cichorium intybus TaxID=13427 RepID=A0ACB9D0Z3_CICIN|nr:hypothetical protein L2E82_30491 [Cichorium intybus]
MNMKRLNMQQNLKNIIEEDAHLQSALGDTNREEINMDIGDEENHAQENLVAEYCYRENGDERPTDPENHTPTAFSGKEVCNGSLSSWNKDSLASFNTTEHLEKRGV